MPSFKHPHFWSYPSYCYSGDYPTQDRELREMPRSFSIKLHSQTQVSDHLGMSGGRYPRHAQNPFLGERRKTLSMTHHAISPPHSHHHLYIIHLINWIQRFYRITMSLKRPFVPKSNVKQWFATTTSSLWSWVRNSAFSLISHIYCMYRLFISTKFNQFTFLLFASNWYNA